MKKFEFYVLLSCISCFFIQGCALDTVVDVTLWLRPIYVLPDLDLWWTTEHPGFFTTLLLGTHRSAVTHSCLLILIMRCSTDLLSPGLKFLGRLLTIVFGLVFAVHFVLDLFPEGYQGGFAYIHFPIVGSLTWIPLDGNLIPWLLSKAWLLINIVLCLYVPFIGGGDPAKKVATEAP